MATGPRAINKLRPLNNTVFIKNSKYTRYVVFFFFSNVNTHNGTTTSGPRALASCTRAIFEGENAGHNPEYDENYTCPVYNFNTDFDWIYHVSIGLLLIITLKCAITVKKFFGSGAPGPRPALSYDGYGTGLVHVK